MSASTSPRTICLPAHILDANISPRSREVLMLLASQTTADNPTLWVCHAAIAERLRCSPVTVKRAIQKLVEAKLIVETGDLHERRFKFYRVKWSLREKSISKCVVSKKPKPTPALQRSSLPLSVSSLQAQHGHPEILDCHGLRPRSDEPTPPTPHPGVDLSAMLKDSRIAHWAEVARQKHEENLRRYQMEVRMLAHVDVPDSDGVLNNSGYET